MQTADNKREEPSVKFWADDTKLEQDALVSTSFPASTSPNSDKKDINITSTANGTMSDQTGDSEEDAEFRVCWEHVDSFCLCLCCYIPCNEVYQEYTVRMSRKLLMSLAVLHSDYLRAELLYAAPDMSVPRKGSRHIVILSRHGGNKLSRLNMSWIANSKDTVFDIVLKSGAYYRTYQ